MLGSSEPASRSRAHNSCKAQASALRAPFSVLQTCRRADTPVLPGSTQRTPRTSRNTRSLGTLHLGRPVPAVSRGSSAKEDGTDLPGKAGAAHGSAPGGSRNAPWGLPSWSARSGRTARGRGLGRGVAAPGGAPPPPGPRARCARLGMAAAVRPPGPVLLQVLRRSTYPGVESVGSTCCRCQLGGTAACP